MKLIDIVNARQIIDSFAEREDVCAHLAYWMTKFVINTRGDYEFYVSALNKLFYAYAQKNADGEFEVPADRARAFNTEVQKLCETEAEDPGIRFSLSELSAELRLSMKQIYPLLDFIDEDK